MYSVFEQLLHQKGVSSYRVSKETGVSQSIFSSWKTGKTAPSKENLKKIADYFGVSIEYLMTGKEPESDRWFTNPETAKLAQEIHDNPDLQAIIHAARDTSPEDMKKIIQMIYVLKGEHKD